MCRKSTTGSGSRARHRMMVASIVFAGCRGIFFQSGIFFVDAVAFVAPHKVSKKRSSTEGEELATPKTRPIVWADVKEDDEEEPAPVQQPSSVQGVQASQEERTSFAQQGPANNNNANAVFLPTPEAAATVPPPPAPYVRSAGTEGHEYGQCALLHCKYAAKVRGCKDGANCVRCHLCPRDVGKPSTSESSWSWNKSKRSYATRWYNNDQCAGGPCWAAEGGSRNVKTRGGPAGGGSGSSSSGSGAQRLFPTDSRKIGFGSLASHPSNRAAVDRKERSDAADATPPNADTASTRTSLPSKGSFSSISELYDPDRADRAWQKKQVRRGGNRGRGGRGRGRDNPCAEGTEASLSDDASPTEEQWQEDPAFRESESAMQAFPPGDFVSAMESDETTLPVSMVWVGADGTCVVSPASPGECEQFGFALTSAPEQMQMMESQSCYFVPAQTSGDMQNCWSPADYDQSEEYGSISCAAVPVVVPDAPCYALADAVAQGVHVDKDYLQRQKEEEWSKFAFQGGPQSGLTGGCFVPPPPVPVAQARREGADSVGFISQLPFRPTEGAGALPPSPFSPEISGVVPVLLPFYQFDETATTPTYTSHHGSMTVPDDLRAEGASERLRDTRSATAGHSALAEQVSPSPEVGQPSDESSLEALFPPSASSGASSTTETFHQTRHTSSSDGEEGDLGVPGTPKGISLRAWAEINGESMSRQRQAVQPTTGKMASQGHVSEAITSKPGRVAHDITCATTREDHSKSGRPRRKQAILRRTRSESRFDRQPLRLESRDAEAIEGAAQAIAAPAESGGSVRTSSRRADRRSGGLGDPNAEDSDSGMDTGDELKPENTLNPHMPELRDHMQVQSMT
ncbi:unnamed protein product [Amoebophrya sp. A120]|nr:unnamed protein product [Amoebophrya sp. A120]|eukprot:GSA120T00004879001.1